PERIVAGGPDDPIIAASVVRLPGLFLGPKGQRFMYRVFIQPTIHGPQVIVVRSRQVLGGETRLHSLVHYDTRPRLISAIGGGDPQTQIGNCKQILSRVHSPPSPPHPSEIPSQITVRPIFQRTAATKKNIPAAQIPAEPYRSTRSGIKAD